MTTAEVIAALQARHAPSRGWVTVPEVTIATGWSTRHLPHEMRPHADRRIDLFAMGTWSSTNFERIAYEVKVSRSDFLAELRDPFKRKGAQLLADRFVFAMPKGVAKAKEIPPDCGIVLVDGAGCRTTRRGAINPNPLLPLPFVASLLRTAAEQRSMGNRCCSPQCFRSADNFRGTTAMRLYFCKSHAERWDRAGLGVITDPRVRT